MIQSIQLPDDVELPALPRTAQALLPLLEQDEPDLDAVVRAIELDPALTGRVVGVARSAYYGSQDNVYTVRDAILRCLGLDLVWNLALGVSLARVFDTAACPAFDLQRYWQGAVVSAALTRAWAGAFPQIGIDPDLGHLTGLLHNLGLLALAHLFPAPMEAALQAHAKHADTPLAGYLRGHLGSDHHEIGALLARRWHLPEASVSVMQFWHDQTHDDGHTALRRLVRAAVIGCRVLRGRLPADRLRDGCASGLGVEPEALLRVLEDVGGRLQELDDLARGLGQGG